MYSLYTKPTTFKEAPVTRRSYKGNVWRELCARAIEKNCGYYSRNDGSALEWTVGVYHSIPDFDRIFEKARDGDYGPGKDADLDPKLLADLKEDWDDEGNQTAEWNWIVEGMQRSVTDSDAYSTLRPEIAARYGLPGSQEAMPRRYKRRTDECAFCPAAKDGWIKVGPYRNNLHFDVEWEFAGRGGKHLCLTSFERRSLEKSSDDLAEAIRNDDERGDYPNWWCQQLVAFIHECDLMFTSKAVDDEFEYQVLFRLGQRLQEVADETKRLRKEEAEAQFWAERDVMTIKKG